MTTTPTRVDEPVRGLASGAFSLLLGGDDRTALGILAALTDEHRELIADAAARLVNIADPVLAQTCAADLDDDVIADPITARALNAAGALSYALRERHGDVARTLDGREHADLLWIRRGVTALLRCIDDRLPKPDDRAHAGLGLSCSVCAGPCRIDDPAATR